MANKARQLFFFYISLPFWLYKVTFSLEEYFL